MSIRAMQFGIRVSAATACILASAAPHAVCARWAAAHARTPTKEQPAPQRQTPTDTVSRFAAPDTGASRTGASRAPLRGGAWLDSALTPTLAAGFARAADARLDAWLTAQWRLRSDAAPSATTTGDLHFGATARLLRGAVDPRSPPGGAAPRA